MRNVVVNLGANKSPLNVFEGAIILWPTSGLACRQEEANLRFGILLGIKPRETKNSGYSFQNDK